MRLSPDLRSLAVLFGPPGSSSSSTAAPEGDPSSPRTPAATKAPSSPSARMGDPASSVAFGAESPDDVVLVLDVRKLAVRRRELMMASLMAERLSAVTDYARRASETLAKVWKSGVDGFAKKVRALEDTVEAHRLSPDSTVHQELLMTCCSGNPSDALHTFLMKQTSVQQLLRLERGLMQALDYANLIVTTRVQVACHHLITILHEMHARAGWEQKFKAIGLEPGPLEGLQAQARALLRLGELLLIECSQARCFAKTFFQLFLRMASKLPDQTPSASEMSHIANCGSPTREDLDEFIARLQQRGSLDLSEVTARIGIARGTADRNVGVSGQGLPDAARGSVVDATHCLAREVEKVGDRICAALSSHTSVLACIQVHAPSPWTSLAVPELKAVASSNAVASVSSARGLGHSTIVLAWESAGQNECPCLLALWTGGGQKCSELHISRLRVPPAPPGAPVRLHAERACLQDGGSSAGPAHFLLCELYGAGKVAALIVQEYAAPRGGGVAASASVCLIDTAKCEFDTLPNFAAFGPAAVLGMPSQANAMCLGDLPEGSIRRRDNLPESCIWASALRAMASRGVCSVYAWRARRLLTLDMEAEGDEDDDEAGN